MLEGFLGISKSMCKCSMEYVFNLTHRCVNSILLFVMAGSRGAKGFKKLSICYGKMKFEQSYKQHAIAGKIKTSKYNDE